MILRCSSLLFCVPSVLGFLYHVPFVQLGCAILTVTSVANHWKFNRTINRIDTAYAQSFSAIGTAMAVYYGLTHLQLWYLYGSAVACSALSTYIYVAHSRNRYDAKADRWHVLVHLAGSVGFSFLACGEAVRRGQVEFQ